MYAVNCSGEMFSSVFILKFIKRRCFVALFFSSEHFRYEAHNCPGAYKKNVQVPVCPLCNTLVPGRVDELPDIRVSRHIDNDCQSDPAVTRRKVGYLYQH